MPPHPIFNDEYIKRKCPISHPPPLTKVYNIAPSAPPRYLKTLPGMKPAPVPIQSPQTMNVMAKSLARGRLDQEKALMETRNFVLATYEKPAKMPPSANLRGASEMDMSGKPNTFMGAVGTTAALYAGGAAAQLAQ